MSLGKPHRSSTTPRRARPLRCAAVWLLATGAAVALLARTTGDLDAARTTLVTGLTTGSWGRAGFDRLLVELSAVTLAGCVTWLWLVTSLVTWEAAAGEPHGGRAVPPGLRRVVLATCGAALAAGSVTPAVAAPAAPAPAVHPDRGGLRGLPLPDRASGGLAERRRSTSAARRAVPASRAAGPTVTVTRGDTLWALAARRLPAAAGVSDVAAACRALYAANRAVVGADPDRIVPGQVLHLPDPTER